MSTSFTWNGVSYSAPAAGERNWAALTSFLTALGASAQATSAQKVGMRVATSSPVTVSDSTDCIIVTALSVAGAVTVNLPAGTSGRVFMIVDGTGDAATNNVTVTPAAGLVNGAATYVISKNRGGVVLAYNGTGWTVVSEFTASSSGAGGIVNSDISASAAIALTKLANITAGSVLMGNASNVPTATALSGDVTVNSSGVTAIGASKVTNAMLAGSIADSKLDTISTASKVSNSATTATSANTASAIVARDASGNFAAGTITANLAGNATTATTATSAGSATTATSATTAGNVTGTVAIANGGTGQVTAAAAFNALSPITTKGDVIAGSGSNTASRLAVGADNTVLMADSAQATGLKWGSVAATVTTTRGDLIARGAAADGRLAIGTVGKFLRSDGTDPGWFYAYNVSTIDTSDSNITLTTSSNKYQSFTGFTASRDVTLPATATIGEVWVLENTAAFDMVVKASGGSALTVANSCAYDATVQKGYVVLRATSATPTTPTGWEVVFVTELFAYSSTYGWNNAGGGTTGTLAGKIRRVNDMCTLWVPQVSVSTGNSNNLAANLTSNTVLLTRFRPSSSSIRILLPAEQNGGASGVIGQVDIGTGGVITISKQDGSVFTQNATGGTTRAWDMTWMTRL